MAVYRDGKELGKVILDDRLKFPDEHTKQLFLELMCSYDLAFKGEGIELRNSVWPKIWDPNKPESVILIHPQEHSIIEGVQYREDATEYLGIQQAFNNGVSLETSFGNFQIVYAEKRVKKRAKS